jgi:hypothetical protein
LNADNFIQFVISGLLNRGGRATVYSLSRINAIFRPVIDRIPSGVRKMNHLEMVYIFPSSSSFSLVNGFFCFKGLPVDNEVDGKADGDDGDDGDDDDDVLFDIISKNEGLKRNRKLSVHDQTKVKTKIWTKIYAQQVG